MKTYPVAEDPGRVPPNLPTSDRIKEFCPMLFDDKECTRSRLKRPARTISRSTILQGRPEFQIYRDLLNGWISELPRILADAEMSAFGTKQTSSEVGSMSAFEPKGDVHREPSNIQALMASDPRVCSGFV